MSIFLIFSDYKKDKLNKVSRKCLSISNFFWLISLAALLLISSCGSNKTYAKIYGFENGELQELYKTVTKKDEDFLIDLINSNYPIGQATGMEESNFVIIYYEGTKDEYRYKLIVDLETDVLTYITDDDGITAPRVFNSHTTSLEFYDFLSK